VNLGSTVNTTFAEGAPALSCDATTLYFYSNRPGGFGNNDLYVSTRHRLRDGDKDSDGDEKDRDGDDKK